MYTLPKMNLYHVDTNSKIWSKSIMQAQFQSQTFPCLKKKKKKKRKKKREKKSGQGVGGGWVCVKGMWSVHFTSRLINTSNLTSQKPGEKR